MLKKSWLIILLAFILPVLGVYAWWGGFHRVQISAEERGPYSYAYLEHKGSYAKIPDTRLKVLRGLQEQGVTPLQAINVLFDDPRHVARADLRANVGYIVRIGDAIRLPLKRAEMPRRKVWVGEVKAAELLAPSKVYQALHDYLRPQGRDIRMPSVELYDSPPEVYRIGVFTVEIPQ